MSKNDGGPAFPHERSNEHFENPNMYYSGMSLRDWFAGQSLPNLSYLRPPDGIENKTYASVIAEYAYEIADAMLKKKGR